MKKLFIKNVERTRGGLSPLLGIDCTDGTGYRIPRDVPRSMFWDATIAILMEEGSDEIITMVKVESFDEKGRPKEFEHIYGKPLRLNGSEEIVDCRTIK